MTEIVVLMTILVSIAGIALSIWSVLSTRKKYYKEYMGRKRND